MSKKILSVAGGLAVVAAGIISVFVIDWSSPEEPQPDLIRPLKTHVIDDGIGNVKRTYPGRVQASRRVDLAFRVTGPLISLSVTSGQEVEAGTVIAEIDPRDFQNRLDDIVSRIAASNANLAAMRRGRPEDIEMLRADVQKAQAEVTLAAAELARAVEAHGRNAMTDLELEQYKARELRRRAELSQANESLRIGENGARPEDIESAEAAIRGLEAQKADAEAALADTRLTAPFSGVIALRYVENFESVQARQPIVSLQNISTVDVVINVPESDLLTKSEEDRFVAFASFEGIPDQRFEMTLKEFAVDADPATQTFEVTLSMPAPEGVNVLPGMTATVNAYAQTAAPGTATAFAVPLSALPIDSSGAYFVWTLKAAEGDTWTVHKSPVEVGGLTGDNAIVVGGLDKGDRIAAAGVRFLTEGQVVRLLDSDGRSAS